MIKKFIHFLVFRRYVNVTIYMKSGNKVVLNKVSTDMKFNSKGDDVISFTGYRRKLSSQNQLVYNTLALGQIEAVTYSRSTRLLFFWK